MINIASLMLIDHSRDRYRDGERDSLVVSYCMFEEGRGSALHCERWRRTRARGGDGERQWVCLDAAIDKTLQGKHFVKMKFRIQTFPVKSAGFLFVPGSQATSVQRGLWLSNEGRTREKKGHFITRGFLSSCVFVKHNLTFWLIKVNCYDYNEI